MTPLSGYLDKVPGSGRASVPKVRSSLYRSGDRAASKAARETAVALESAAAALVELSEVEVRMRTLEATRIRLIGAAQQLGASWEDIGSSLGVSRQAAWEKYRDLARALLDLTASRARLPEGAVLESAGEVLKDVRARRRRR